MYLEVVEGRAWHHQLHGWVIRQQSPDLYSIRGMDTPSCQTRLTDIGCIVQGGVRVSIHRLLPAGDVMQCNACILQGERCTHTPPCEMCHEHLFYARTVPFHV